MTHLSTTTPYVRYSILLLTLCTVQHSNTMELDSIYVSLNTVLTDIKDAYQKQFAEFNASPTSKIPVLFTPKVQKAVTSLKNTTATLAKLLSSTQLQDEAGGLRFTALQIIDSMQVIDGNIEKAVLPDGEKYKKIVTDTLMKLQKLEKESKNTIREMGKLKRDKNSPFEPDEIIAVENCARIIMNLASTVREANEKILNVFFKPKKGFFEKLFGK